MWEGGSIRASGIGAQSGYEWKIASLQKLHYVNHNTKLLKMFVVLYKGMLLPCWTPMKCLQMRDDLKDELPVFAAKILHTG